MKNSILYNLLFIFILITIIGCNKEVLPIGNDLTIENDLTKMKLNGNVKSIEIVILSDYHNRNNIEKVFSRKDIYFFDSLGNEIEHSIFEHGGRFEDKRINKYDKKGNRISSISYDSVGVIQSRSSYKFNKDGNIIREKSFISEGEIPWKELIYKYNVNSDLVERVVFDNGVEYSKMLLSYDENRNKIDKEIYLKNLKGEFYLVFRSYYKYDIEGNLVEKSDTHWENVLQLRNTRKYDSRGYLIENIHYKSDGSLSRRIVNKFDNRNNKIERLEYGSDDILSGKNHYKYDISGNEIEEKVYNSNGILYHLKNHRYDENGNPIESVFTSPTKQNSRKNDYSWEYEYDENKNWIKSIFYINEERNTTTEKKIEYY